VARVVKELLSAKLVTPHPSTEDIPSPPVVEGEVMEGCPVLIGFPSPLAASAKPAALGVAPPPCRQAHLTGRARRGSFHPRLLKPRRRLPYMKPSRQRLGHRWLCNLCPLHGGTSSPAAPSRCFGVPCGLLQPTRGTMVEVLCCHDRCCEFPTLELSSCRWSGSPEGSHP
jgi:hypothetical protein